MKVNLCLVILVIVSSRQVYGKAKVKKRQIYREEVLPHQGGKIPDTAFQTDRLALNQLQKEGIAIPDGILLEHRMNSVYPYESRSNRPVFRVTLTDDERYTPSEGRYIHSEPTSIQTTYLLPQVYRESVRPSSSQYPRRPVFRPIALPNPYLKGYGSIYQQQPSSLTQNQHPLNHQDSSEWSRYHEDYLTSHIFNDFETFFNNYNGQHAELPNIY